MDGKFLGKKKKRLFHPKGNKEEGKNIHYY